MAAIAVVFGIVNNVTGVFYQTLAASGGPVVAQLFGIFSIPACLAGFIIRKPGAALITFLLNSLVQALAGNPAGFGTLGWGVTVGLGAELAFAATRYRNYGPVVMFISGGLSEVLGNLWTYTLFGLWGTLASAPQVFLGVEVVGFIAFGVESGLVALVLGTILLRSGLLRSFAASRQTA
jgi:energy-coupling factor transport system substrate-specific component